MARRDRSRELYDAVHALSGDLGAPEARATLQRALKSRSGRVVAKAATVVGAHRLAAHEAALLGAYERLFVDGARRDPGCDGKVAVIEALLALDHLDPEPLLRGARARQPEPVWGGTVDAAAGLRARCGHGLVSLGYPDAEVVLAELLADSEERVREEAARALGHRGGVAARALLTYALHRSGPSEDPAVLEAQLLALLAVDLEAGLRVAAPALAGGSHAWREAALFALASTREEAVVPLLIEACDAAVRPADRARVLTALAVQRTEASRVFLLQRIEEGSPEEARAVVRALASQRFDLELERRAREAAARNAEVDLTALLDEVFTLD